MDVQIYTHKIRGLTESDFVLAAKIDRMYLQTRCGGRVRLLLRRRFAGRHGLALGRAAVLQFLPLTRGKHHPHLETQLRKRARQVAAGVDQPPDGLVGLGRIDRIVIELLRQFLIGSFHITPDVEKMRRGTAALWRGSAGVARREVEIPAISGRLHHA